MTCIVSYYYVLTRLHSGSEEFVGDQNRKANGYYIYFCKDTVFNWDVGLG